MSSNVTDLVMVHTELSFWLVPFNDLRVTWDSLTDSFIQGGHSHRSPFAFLSSESKNLTWATLKSTHFMWFHLSQEKHSMEYCFLLIAWLQTPHKHGVSLSFTDIIQIQDRMFDTLGNPVNVSSRIDVCLRGRLYSKTAKSALTSLPPRYCY